jgi:hypothetical protein
MTCIDIHVSRIFIRGRDILYSICFILNNNNVANICFAIEISHIPKNMILNFRYLNCLICDRS